MDDGSPIPRESASAAPGTPLVERVDQLAVFGAPRLWVALLAVVAVILSALAWATIARAPEAVDVQGVISTTGGLREVVPSRGGTATGVFVSVGERVVAGNNIVELEDDNGERFRVQAPSDGVIIELTAQPGNYAAAGTPVATLQSLDEQLLAIALVPVSDSGAVAVGDEALISPATAPAGDFGYVRGTVTSIADVPMSQARLDQLTGDLSGFTSLREPTTPVVEIHIDMTRDDSAPSGLEWTQGSGPDAPLIGGTPCEGLIIVGHEAPISRLLG